MIVVNLALGLCEYICDIHLVGWYIIYIYHNEAMHQRKMLGYITETLPCGWCITL